MAENHAILPESVLRFPDALVHRMVGEYKIVFKRARCRFRNRCCCHVIVSAFSPGREVPFVRRSTPRNGDVESLPAAPVDPLSALADPTYGDVEAQLTLLLRSIDATIAPFVTKIRTASLRRGPDLAKRRNQAPDLLLREAGDCASSTKRWQINHQYEPSSARRVRIPALRCGGGPPSGSPRLR